MHSHPLWNPHLAAPTSRIRFLLGLLGVVLAAVSPASATPTLGFREDFTSGTSGWTSAATVTNPGTGGTGGAGDGYLLMARTLPDRLGANSTSTAYGGDWVISGITQIRLWLTDPNADEDLEIHLSIGNSGNLWQYNVGFIPPNGKWGSFLVDLTDSTQFSRIIGTGAYLFALETADRLLIRHDKAPFMQVPEFISGDFGLDHILLTDGVVGVAGFAPFAARPVEMAPAFPNPSQGPVTLAFRSFTEDPLRVEIVDVLGRRVRTEVLPGALGPRSWSWDGRNDRGVRTAPGAYRARVIGPAGGASQPIVRVD